MGAWSDALLYRLHGYVLWLTQGLAAWGRGLMLSYIGVCTFWSVADAGLAVCIAI